MISSWGLTKRARCHGRPETRLISSCKSAQVGSHPPRCRQMPIATMGLMTDGRAFIITMTGLLEVISPDSSPLAPALAVGDDDVRWSPFAGVALNQTLHLRNTHPYCQSRTIMVRLKPGGAAQPRWGGAAVAPGRRFEEAEEGKGEGEEVRAQRAVAVGADGTEGRG
jgi:hypothetical protein